MTQEFKEYTFDNGLHVALKDTPTRTTYAVLRVKHGSLNEKPEEHGIAHFLEHNLFNGGTRKYSPEEVKQLQSRFGGSNAATSHDEIYFYADMVSDRLESLLDLFSDVVFNPRLDQTVMEQERQRVLREISMKKSKPEFQDFRKFITAFYGANSPHAYLNIGKEEIVKSADVDKLREFHSRGFFANNMELIIAGGLVDDTLAIVQKYFSDAPSGPDSRFSFLPPDHLKRKIVFHVPAPDLINLERPEESNAYLELVFQVPALKDAEAPAIEIVNNISGSDSYSRIFDRISQKMGLAYIIGSSYSGFKNNGVMSVIGTIKATEIYPALDAIFEEFRRLQIEPVSDSELIRTKDDIEYNLLKSMETNPGNVNRYVRERDENFDLDQYAEAIIRVTPKDILEAANKHLPTDRENGKYALLIRDPLKE